MVSVGLACESEAMDPHDPADLGQPEPERTNDSEIAAPSVSRLPLVAMGAVVVLAIFVAIALGLRGPTEFPEGTPEAAVQDYLQGVLDGDDEAVLATLAADRVEECRDELAQYGTYGIDGIGFELDEIDVTGDTARAELTQRSTSSGDPFGGTQRYGDRYVELRRENGEWKVDGASWPWRLESCLRTP